MTLQVSEINIEWHVCLGDTSVQIYQKLKAFMTETGHEPKSFPDRIMFINDVTNSERPKV